MAQIVDIIKEWQESLASIVGFCAAILAVKYTLAAEKRKSAAELQAIRRSLAVEIRQFTIMALRAHGSFRNMVENANQKPITVWMVKRRVRVNNPVIYPAAADKVGLLQSEAMEVVIFYDLIEIARRRVIEIHDATASENVPVDAVAELAEAMITICLFAQTLLPKLKTNISTVDDRDDELIKAISAAYQDWGPVFRKWVE